jgi:hypothetical protein
MKGCRRTEHLKQPCLLEVNQCAEIHLVENVRSAEIHLQRAQDLHQELGSGVGEEMGSRPVQIEQEQEP